MSGDRVRPVGPYAMGPRAADLEVRPGALDVIGLREVCRGATIGLVMSTTVASASVRWLLRGGRGQWADNVAPAVADGFERLGPTFVKLGQLMASTSGCVSAAARGGLPALARRRRPGPCGEHPCGHRSGPRLSHRHTVREFDDIPLASGVGRPGAPLRLADGREAVLKVQRPGIGARMMVDLRLAYLLATIAEQWLPRVRTANARGVVRDLHAAATVELNSALEAHNQAKMRANIAAFGDNPMVTAPEIYWEYCGPRVICMERLYGAPIDRIAAAGFDRARPPRC